MKINILIEQLILDGLPIEQRDGAAVQKAVESELAQLIEQNERGSAQQPGVSLPSALAGSRQMESDSDPKSPIARPVNKCPDQA